MIQMKHGLLIMPIYFVIFYLLLPLASLADTVEGYVYRIHDGDTLWIMDSDYQRHKIRLAGIDSPEAKQTGGNQATIALAKLVVGQDVIVEYHKHDRNKRKIGKVFLNGQDMCLQMIRDGHAWHFTKYRREQTEEDQKVYKQAEEVARKQRVGLWSQSNPLPPWEFRKRK